MDALLEGTGRAASKIDLVGPTAHAQNYPPTPYAALVEALHQQAPGRAPAAYGCARAHGSRLGGIPVGIRFRPCMAHRVGD